MNRRAEQPFARSDEAAAAVVTGASSGIGAVFARELARRGYDLLLVARREALLGELAEELASAHGVAAAACPADLSRPDGVERVRRRVAETPNLEMLVNNAGFGMHGDFTEVAPASHMDMIHVHVVASVRLCRAALPGMIARRRGFIINVSSVAGFRAIPGKTTYCATKAYLNVFSEALQAELADTGVRVQALCPGFTYTGFHDSGQYRFDRSRIPPRLWMSAEDVVAASLKALGGKRVVCIPGWKNRLFVRLARSWISGPIISAVFSK